jgi:hypothetical protein
VRTDTDFDFYCSRTCQTPSVDRRDRVRICGRASQGPSAGGRLAISTISCIPAEDHSPCRGTAPTKPAGGLCRRYCAVGFITRRTKDPVFSISCSNCKPSPAPPSQLNPSCGCNSQVGSRRSRPRGAAIRETPAGLASDASPRVRDSALSTTVNTFYQRTIHLPGTGKPRPDGISPMIQSQSYEYTDPPFFPAHHG